MSEMIIKIQEIGPDGESRSLPFEPSWWKTELAGVDAELGASRAGADVDIHRVGENVMVHGRMYGTVTVPCGRCLAPAMVDLATSIHMTYSRDPEVVDVDLENPDDDVDFATYDGDEIDLAELFREQILLAIPMTPLCREECKGLCSQCGKDLNQGPCSCERPKKDSPFEGLKGLKLS
jgi:uncharacterized protein